MNLSHQTEVIDLFSFAEELNHNDLSVRLKTVGYYFPEYRILTINCFSWLNGSEIVRQTMLETKENLMEAAEFSQKIPELWRSVVKLNLSMKQLDKISNISSANDTVLHPVSIHPYR